jgi:hypothetical protein
MTITKLCSSYEAGRTERSISGPFGRKSPAGGSSLPISIVSTLPSLFLSVTENSRPPPVITEQPKNMTTSYGTQETPHGPSYYGKLAVISKHSQKYSEKRKVLRCLLTDFQQKYSAFGKSLGHYKRYWKGCPRA